MKRQVEGGELGGGGDLHYLFTGEVIGDSVFRMGIIAWIGRLEKCCD